MHHWSYSEQQLKLRRGTSGSFGVPAERDDKRPPFDIEALDGYALERWEVGSNPDYVYFAITFVRPLFADNPSLHGVVGHRPTSHKTVARCSLSTAAQRTYG